MARNFLADAVAADGDVGKSDSAGADEHNGEDEVGEGLTAPVEDDDDEVGAASVHENPVGRHSVQGANGATGSNEDDQESV